MYKAGHFTENYPADGQLFSLDYSRLPTDYIKQMKNSAMLSSQGGSNPPRIKIGKRESSPSYEQGKRSINIAETLEHEKAMTQSYREKNERNIIKCRFLYNKLSALGNLEGIPQMIAGEVSEVDVKLKELELQLHFKRSEQMKKLRKKVATFLQQINFEIMPQEMEKIEDEIELVLFLLDIFEEKFNEMTSERKEINDIIARLEESSSLNPQESQHIRKENQELNGKINLLEAEINKLKNEDMKKLEADLLNRDRMMSNSSEAQLSVGFRSQEVEKGNRRIQELEGQVKDLETRHQVLANNLDRARREQSRWKERYRLMEAQKDERIKILEESLSKKTK